MHRAARAMGPRARDTAVGGATRRVSCQTHPFTSPGQCPEAWLLIMPYPCVRLLGEDATILFSVKPGIFTPF
jgi:hypothetical protein